MLAISNVSCLPDAADKCVGKRNAGRQRLPKTAGGELRGVFRSETGLKDRD